jgi:vacuolar-type H+-ATPase subunit I/STV1
MEGVQMSDNILTKSTDLGIGNVTVGNLVEMMRGTPPPTWEQTCLDLDKKLADSRQYVTELENRLRALWDKYDGDRKHYIDRIKRMEEAGDAMLNAENDDEEYKAILQWHKAKEAKL